MQRQAKASQVVVAWHEAGECGPDPLLESASGILGLPNGGISKPNQHPECCVMKVGKTLWNAAVWP